MNKIWSVLSLFCLALHLIIYPILLLSPVILSGCAVVTVADAAVSVGATAVKAGAAVVGTAVDVTTMVAKGVAGSDSGKK